MHENVITIFFLNENFHARTILNAYDHELFILILKKFYNCGAREFVVLAHFPIGPKVRTEENSCRGQVAKIQMA